MSSFFIYNGNNCKIIRENLHSTLLFLSNVCKSINLNDKTYKKNPKIYDIPRNLAIQQIKTLMIKVNTCKDLSIQELKDLYQKPKFDVLCLERGFNQHTGECWNDSIMMFFCYQDELKDIVQRKLYFLEAEEIIEIALSKDIKLPPKYNNLVSRKELINRFKVYLSSFINKFKSYYNNTKFPLSKEVSIEAAIKALEIIKDCPIGSNSKHGAQDPEIEFFIRILSLFLLNCNLETVHIHISKISPYDEHKYIGYMVGWSDYFNITCFQIYIITILFELILIINIYLFNICI